MSPQKELIAKDLFPRALSIALIAVMAWIVTSYIDKSDEDDWQRTLIDANEHAIEAFSGTLQRRIESASQLARDSRFQPLFDPAFDIGDSVPKSARRALYEFKYINEVDHAYIFSSILGELVLTSAGSPPLPAGSLTPYYTAAQENLERLTNISTIGGQTYMTFGHSIVSETGRIIGYAIYADVFPMFYKDVTTPLRGIQNIEFDSYLIEGTGALSVPNYTKKATSVRIVNINASDYPIFDGNFTPKKFSLSSGKNVLANGGFVIEIPKWRIVTSVDMKHVHSASDHKRVILTAVMIIGALLIMLIPISGPYSTILKKIYSKTGLVKAPKPAISDDDISRMRLDPPPPLGNKEAAKKRNRKFNQERTKAKEDYKPSEAVIAYNIRTGIKNRRMKLLYQPIFDAKTNEIIMYETYLRIIDDEGKVMQPSLWLPVARKENLFSLIDETVVSIAVEKFFVRDDPLHVSLAFNISGNTFGSLEFLEKLMSASTSAYPIAEHTIFELRSREIIEDKRAMNFIKECREMGFRFSIDYFGGGPQTLKAAKTLKFDFVKIDILQFDLTKPEGQKEFIRLVKTAEAIDLPVIIEKIEDEKMLRFCKKVGANFVQGYHLAEPNVDLLKR